MPGVHAVPWGHARGMPPHSTDQSTEAELGSASPVTDEGAFPNLAFAKFVLNHLLKVFFWFDFLGITQKYLFLIIE